MSIDSIIQPNFSHALSMALLHSLWQGLAIVILVSLITHGKIKQRTENIYLIHYSALVVLFLFFMGTFYYYYAGGVRNSSVIAWMTSPFSQSGIIESAESNLIQSLDWKWIVSMFWFFGCLIFLLRSAKEGISLYRIFKHAKPVKREWLERFELVKKRLAADQNIRLLTTSKTYIPLAMGIIRPTIIFPTSFFTHLNPEQVESILLHEIAHINRHDFLFNIVQSMIESVLFFNPATWWLSHGIRKYREYYCDDLVQLHVKDKKSYLEALYKVACYSLKPPRMAPALINKKSILIMRVKRMLDTPSNDFQLKPVIGFVVGLLVFFTSLSFTMKPALTASTPSEQVKLTEIKPNLDVPVSNVNNEFEINKNEIFTSIEKSKNDPYQDRSDSHPADVKSTNNIALSTIKASEVVSRLETRLYRKIDHPVQIESVQDTIKKNARILELEKMIQMKSEEIEALSEKLSVEMEQNIQIQAQQIEELSRELERKLEPRIEQMQENAISEEKMQKIEQLSEELEQRLESRMKVFEEKMNSPEMKQREEEMETLSERIEELYDEDQEGNKEEIDRLKDEIKGIGKKMKESMKGMKEEHKRIMEDPEIKEIKAKMESLSKEIREEHKNMENEIWDPESKALKEQMKKLQLEMKENMKGMNKELKTQIKAKSEEIKKLSLELRDEYRKLKKEEEK